MVSYMDKAKMHLLTVLLENALQSVEGRQLNLLQSLILAFFI